MEEDYPTEKQLESIALWDYKDFYGLAEYVCNLWHFQDWAEYRPEKEGEFGEKYRELRLATAGWSGNEDIIAALRKNWMFMSLCWQSSHRGGLYIFHIKKIND